MRKVILNKCYGGFEVSRPGYELYAKKKGLELFCYELDIDNLKDTKNFIYKYAKKDNDIFKHYYTKDFGNNVKISDEDYEKYNLYLDESYREDSTLIEVVEELGNKVNTNCSDLKIVEIPDDLDYVIDNYDGIETLHQDVETW